MRKRLQQIWDKLVEKVIDKITTAVIASVLIVLAALVVYFRQARDPSFYFWLGVLCASCLVALIAFPLTLVQRRRRRAKEQKDRWLYEIAEADRQNLDKCVRVERCELNLRGLTSDPPYLDFTFTVFNGSVFRISVEDNVKGVIVFRNQPLTGSRDIIYDLKNMSRGEIGRFTLHQILDSRHAELISEASENQDDWLIFDHLTITVIGSDNQPEIIPQRLNLMRGITKSGWVIWHR